MSGNSKIEWTESIWNPIRGCTKVSPGCANCYAETFAERWRGIPGHPYEQGFDLRLVPDKLDEPLKRKKPTTYFVNSMSDLFQEGVPDEYIDRVFVVMAFTKRHTFQVLTKRADRMRAYALEMASNSEAYRDRWDVARKWLCGVVPAFREYIGVMMAHQRWPLPNVWLGVSVENQHFADERIPLLLQTSAAVRFISAEPLLGPVSLDRFIGVPDDELHCSKCGCAWEEDLTHECPAGFGPSLDWVIVGGESGPGARAFDVEWARSIIAQCRAAGVACFVKQLGARIRWGSYGGDSGSAMESRVAGGITSAKAGNMAEWPTDLRVREMPTRQFVG